MYNEVRAEAHSAKAKGWVDKFNLNYSATYTLETHKHGAAELLSKLWLHNMQFLWFIWIASAEDPHCYTAEVLDTYEEPADIAGRIFAELPLVSQRRVHEIRNIRPMLI